MPGVRDAAVIPSIKSGKVDGLVAFVVLDLPTDDPPSAASALRRALGQKVPAYMVPRQVHFLDALPMNANGKADRKALEASRPSFGG